jgi:Flp pilus assembly protein TadG
MGVVTEINPRRRRRLDRAGQSIAEFALLLPIMLILFLAIADFARLYSTMITIEAAAREGADFGTLYPWWWQGNPSDPDSNAGKTVAEMERRACLAASTLPDYVGTASTCTNPTVAYQLVPPMGVTDCAAVARDEDPCWVKVTLSYTFHLIAPINFRLGDVELGFPSDLTFTRSSVFAVSDFELDATDPPGP